jgi:hypothetical protein
MAESLMDISSIALSLSTRKLNNPKAISKPLVLTEVGLVEPETDSMIAVAAGLTTSPEAIVGSTPLMLSMGEALLMMVSMAYGTLSMAVSMAVLMADVALLMAVSMAVLMADGALSMAVSMADGALSMAMVGEGASESVDPDPVVPTVGAN